MLLSPPAPCTKVGTLRDTSEANKQMREQFSPLGGGGGQGGGGEGEGGGGEGGGGEGGGDGGCTGALC